MNTEKSNEEELQKILALKQHELPPRQFFSKLSGKVIQRLQKPEPPAELTWRQKLGLDFDTNPVLVCASGVAVCGLLLLGLILSLRVKPPAPAPALPGDKVSVVVTPVSPSHPEVVLSAPVGPIHNAPSKRGSIEPILVEDAPSLKPLPNSSKLQEDITIPDKK
jgi:hypothetical protein